MWIDIRSNRYSVGTLHPLGLLSAWIFPSTRIATSPNSHPSGPAARLTIDRSGWERLSSLTSGREQRGTITVSTSRRFSVEDSVELLSNRLFRIQRRTAFAPPRTLTPQPAYHRISRRVARFSALFAKNKGNTTADPLYSFSPWVIPSNPRKGFVGRN